jgi:D-glucosaminate-6-phosphate ammonia-lyase
VPRHGIGRSCKVGKEQVVGLLAALLRFTEDDDDARNKRHAAVVQSLMDVLHEVASLRVRRVADLGHGALPLVEVVISPAANLPNAAQVAARLRAANPSIHVDATNADQGILMLVPTCLGSGDAPAIGLAFAEAMAERV